MAPIPLERWQRACRAVGAHDGDGEYRRLLRAWRTWGRHYHTLGHLAACLRELDQNLELAQAPAEVELALWFHDAIYRTYRNDNEARSAAWATQFLQRRGANPGAVERVREHVLMTRHAAAPEGGDGALVVDIDLSILGQPPNVYDMFERNVRREYWWVRRRRFAAARSAILESFLRRPTIYHWPRFRARYETAARRNLERAITALRNG
jgi:predicted metal-dependent HD superfamily phosphohydrolase